MNDEHHGDAARVPLPVDGQLVLEVAGELVRQPLGVGGPLEVVALGEQTGHRS